MEPNYVPYIGPRPFEERYMDRFFGRDNEIQDLQILITAHQVIILFAQSGAGKSSLLNAGLIPLLKKARFEVLPTARIRRLAASGVDVQRLPKDIYVFNTIASWVQEGTTPEAIAGITISDFLKRREHPQDEDGVPFFRVLIFDQFEEIFTAYAERREERGPFFEQIASALDDDPLLRVLFVIREDYLANFEPYVISLPEEASARYRLEPLRKDAAIEAVEKPLKGTGRSFKEGVAEHLVDELLKIRIIDEQGETKEIPGEYVEPVQLQIVCENLWKNLKDDEKEITLEHVHIKGNVDEALRDFYKRVIETTAKEKGISESDLGLWFEKYLITPEGTRGIVHCGKETTGGIPNAVVEYLEDEHHIVRADIRGGGGRWYELTHDRFIDPILKGNQALHEKLKEQEQQRQTRRLEEKQLQLEKERRGKILYMSSFIVAFMLLIVALVAIWSAHVSKSRAEKAFGLAEQRRVAAVAAFESLEAANKKTEEALDEKAAALEKEKIAKGETEEALKASKALNLAAAAINHLNVDPEQGLLLALQAASVSATTTKTVPPAVENALHQSVQTSRLLRTFSSGHRDLVWSAALSPDKRRLAMTYDFDKVLILESVSGKEQLRLVGHEDEVTSVAFSPDGRRIGTSSSDNTARLWNADTGKELCILGQHTEDVVRIAFSRNGRFIATSSMDKTAIIWKSSDGKLLRKLTGHAGTVWDVAFSPDGNRLATASEDKTAIIWDTATGKPIRTLRDEDYVYSVAFSPDGRRLATGNKSGRVIIWDTDSGRQVPLPHIPRHAGATMRLVFSPDGRRLVTGGSDGKAKIWDAASGREISTFYRTDDLISDIKFSNDGSLIVTASFDGTARLWSETGRSISPSPFANVAASIRAIAVSRDGTKLATAGGNRKIIVWDLMSGKIELTIKSDKGALRDIAFSPDGALIASADRDGVVILWDASTGEKLDELPGNKDGAHGLAFSPDGKRLATAAENKTAIIQDIESGKPLFTLKHSQPVRSVTFSSDGKLVATAQNGFKEDFSYDNMVVIWDARTGEKKTELKSQTRISRIAFSPDSVYVAAACDHVARIWRWDSDKQPPITLTGHFDSILSVGFDTTGRLVTTASKDHMAKIWYASDGRELMTFDGHKGAVSDVSFIPKTARLVTSGWDGTVKEWSTRLTLELSSPVAYNSRVTGISFSPNGRLVVTASFKDQATISDVRGGSQKDIKLSGFEGAVYATAFSVDGKVATAHGDKKVRIWDAASGALLAELDGHTDDVLAVAFSRDNKQVASSGLDGKVIVWDLASKKPVRTVSISQKTKSPELQEGQSPAVKAALKELLYVMTGDIESVAIAFNSNLTLVASVNPDGVAAVVREIATGKKVASLTGHTDRINSIAFSDDDKWVVTACADGTVKTWDSQSGKERLTLKGHKGAVMHAVFSKDGTRIATASVDRTAEVWEAATGQIVYTLPGHYSGLTTVALSPDGKWIATGEMNGYVDVYVQDAEMLMTLARQRLTRPLNEEECRQFISKDGQCPQIVTAIDYYVKGRNDALSGNFRQAIADFRRSQQFDNKVMSFNARSEAAEIANERGKELIRMELYDEAKELLEKTAKFDPDNDYTYYLLGSADVGLENWGSAASYFKRVRKGSPYYVSALEYEGQIYHDYMGRYEDGYRIYSLIVDLRPRDIEDRMNLAEACITTQRWDKARNQAQGILQEYKLWRLNDCQRLTMRFIIISSLVLQGKDETAHKSIKDFLGDYNERLHEYTPSWKYTGTRSFLNKDVKDSVRKNCLLKLVDALEKPSQKLAAEDLGEYMNSPGK